MSSDAPMTSAALRKELEVERSARREAEREARAKDAEIARLKRQCDEADARVLELHKAWVRFRDHVKAIVEEKYE